MQDRYAGDIGDFGKLALLKALAREGLSIGVNWYKTAPAEKEALNADGKFLIPERFAVCDPELAGKLNSISSSERRSIAALENANILPDAFYYSTQMAVENRREWHQEALNKLSNVDLVFLDPDNGLLVKSVGRKSAKSIKYVFPEEIFDYLNKNQSILLYQHRCRKKPALYFDERLQSLKAAARGKAWSIQAIAFPKGSIRDYFAISVNPDHDAKIRNAFESLAYGIWGDQGFCRLQPLPYVQCPSCGRDRLKPIVYGMPSAAALELEQNGHIVLGGCCIEEHSPNWQCSSCSCKF